MHYCDLAKGHPLHGPYHDTEYGFPVENEHVLFERLALEIMQAGLSWEIVLKKRAALHEAFDGFDPDKVGAYGTEDEARLLANPAIIRNRRKIQAIIANAKTLVGLRASHEGFAKWLASHHPRDKELWTRLFRETFAFTGGEIVGEFLMSIGLLPGAHHEGCEIYALLSVGCGGKRGGA